MSVNTEVLEKLGKLEARCDEGCGKKVPLGLILAICVQTFAIIWWAAGVDGTVQRIESSMHKTLNETEVKNFIAEREKVYMEMDGDRHLSMQSRMVRVESNFKHINKALDRIEGILTKKIWK